MGIFDRLKRLARAEINEMKRVLSDDDDDPRAAAQREEDERQRMIREAEDELARAEDGVLAAEIEAGAALWGHPDAPNAPNAPLPPRAPDASSGPNAPLDVERGASLWGPEPGLFEVPGAPRPPDAGVAPERPAGPSGEPPRPPYESRTHAFPREVRDAYAVLELPLGSDRPSVEAAFRDLLHRYHPDKHAGDARRESVAHELTIRIREARDVLLAWLSQAGR
ncbi:MAG: DnaJ domain-containing protein [Deltaproteobacteria bacterium]|nr:DnaJ domain-containing protein [Deltaproteobacteria bacterium]